MDTKLMPSQVHRHDIINRVTSTLAADKRKGDRVEPSHEVASELNFPAFGELNERQRRTADNFYRPRKVNE